MQIRVLASTLIGGVWHEPGVGNYEDSLAQQLIDIGSAELYETKVITEIQTKKKARLTSASLPVPASRKKIVRKSKAKRK